MAESLCDTSRVVQPLSNATDKRSAPPDIKYYFLQKALKFKIFHLLLQSTYSIYCFMIHTYQIQINESVPLGQSIVALLRSASDVVSFHAIQNDQLKESLKSGFKDVREIIDGKQKKTTIDEFIKTRKRIDIAC